MSSTLNCSNIVCIVTVSDVAAAYLLKIRQATYSYIRRAPPPLHQLVLLRNKCQKVRMVCYTRVRFTPKYSFFLFCIFSHSTVCSFSALLEYTIVIKWKLIKKTLVLFVNTIETAYSDYICLGQSDPYERMILIISFSLLLMQLIDIYVFIT